MISEQPQAPSRPAWRSALFAGLLPLIAFTVIEERYGPLWGTVAGLVFGVGEIIYEYASTRKVSGLTWIGNGLIFFLGGISIFTQDGVWFKLQPAIMELFFALFLWGSLLMRKNILLVMATKQQQVIPPALHPHLNALTLRLGCFMAAHAALATWAALYWSTIAWVWLKGIGFTVSLLIYFLGEALYLRYQRRGLS